MALRGPCGQSSGAAGVNCRLHLFDHDRGRSVRIDMYDLRHGDISWGEDDAALGELRRRAVQRESITRVHAFFFTGAQYDVVLQAGQDRVVVDPQHVRNETVLDRGEHPHRGRMW